MSATDPLGHGTVTSYDALNRPYQTVDAVGATTTLAYDDAGRLKSLTDPVSNVTTWTYDDAGRKTAETDPNSKVTHYGYDDANRLTSITDRLGHIRTYQYNAADQMTGEIWYPDSKSAAVHAVAYGRDANGNLTSATDALSSGNSAFDTSISYDLLNRPTHVAEAFGVTLDDQYDAADNRTQVVDNQGGQTDSTYDDLNRLTTMTLSGSGVTGTRTTWGYDAAGDMAGITKETASGSGWSASGSTDYHYDDLGRNDAITQKNGAGTTVGAYTFTLDLGDRLTASKYVTWSVTSSHSFGYDDSNRLKSADGVNYTYDKAGNPTGTGYTLGVANRMTSDGVWTYAYDDAGQMTGKSKSGEAWTYAYDYNGQMVSASKSATVGGTVTDSVAYTFDAIGNRLSRVQTGGTSKTERFAYDGADAFLDLNGSNAVTARRQYGPGVDNLLSRQSGGCVEWYGTDMQGSVRQVFDNAGKATSWADYEAHGALVGGSLTDRYGFTGRELDSLTGQQYNRARVLDGQSWTSEDPMGFAAGDANLRRYVGNGPTIGTDPSGLEEDSTKNKKKRKPNGDGQHFVPKVKVGERYSQYMTPRALDLIWGDKSGPCGEHHGGTQKGTGIKHDTYNKAVEEELRSRLQRLGAMDEYGRPTKYKMTEDEMNQFTRDLITGENLSEKNRLTITEFNADVIKNQKRVQDQHGVKPLPDDKESKIKRGAEQRKRSGRGQQAILVASVFAYLATTLKAFANISEMNDYGKYPSMARIHSAYAAGDLAGVLKAIGCGSDDPYGNHLIGDMLRAGMIDSNFLYFLPTLMHYLAEFGNKFNSIMLNEYDDDDDDNESAKVDLAPTYTAYFNGPPSSMELAERVGDIWDLYRLHPIAGDNLSRQMIARNLAVRFFWKLRRDMQRGVDPSLSVPRGDITGKHDLDVLG